jgi:hypothetical protein
MSEIDILFYGPLFSVGLTTKSEQGRKPALALVTSFVQKLLTEKEKENGAVGAALMLVWKHVSKWESNPVNYDVGMIRKQAVVFKKEPFSGFKGDSWIDDVVLRKLCKFALE